MEYSDTSDDTLTRGLWEIANTLKQAVETAVQLRNHMSHTGRSHEPHREAAAITVTINEQWIMDWTTVTQATMNMQLPLRQEPQCSEISL